MDIRAILMQLRAGVSQRQIERELKINRRTVKKCRDWAEQQGLLAGELPPLEALQVLLAQTMSEAQPPQNVSTVADYRAVVEKLVNEKVETMAIYQRLQEKGFSGTYMAVYRFVRQLKGQPLRATVRVERQPGEEVQVDFGFAGWLIDPGRSDSVPNWRARKPEPTDLKDFSRRGRVLGRSSGAPRRSLVRSLVRRVGS